MSPHGAAHPAHAHDEEHLHPHGGKSLEDCIARLEDPEREAWQKPGELVAALGLRKGDRLLDLGAGTGYLAFRCAEAVGPGGHVYAADVDPGMLASLRERMVRSGVGNVSPMLVPEGDPTLPEGSVDVALTCNTYHHVEERVALLGRIARCLVPGGRMVIVDFHKRELPLGPPMEMKVARERVVAELQEAGFRLESELTLLPHQYVLVARR